jgi:hypothetical protein
MMVTLRRQRNITAKQQIANSEIYEAENKKSIVRKVIRSHYTTDLQITVMGNAVGGSRGTANGGSSAETVVVVVVVVVVVDVLRGHK